MLGKEHREVMGCIINGADIFSRKKAELLREVEDEHPEYIIIGPAVGDYDIRRKRPYFGAILTDAGVEFYLKNSQEEKSE